MNRDVIVDVGTCTVKVYQNDRQIDAKSIDLKNNFDPQNGLAPKIEAELVNFLNKIKTQVGGRKIKVFATAIFRKMTADIQTKTIDKIFMKTGLKLNIISQELESFFLGCALLPQDKLSYNIMILNIGGGSTEIIIKKTDGSLEKINLGIGVGTVLKRFPKINESVCQYEFDEISSFVKSLIPNTDITVPVAVYSGGEMTYMKLAGYKLQDNSLYFDNEHPLSVDLSSFSRKNEEILYKTTIEQLRGLMPKNPTWMNGARPCSILAQCIFEKFGVENIVPSNSDIAHGIFKQEYRSVVLSGSFRKHLDYIKKIKQRLEDNGVTILSPRFVTPKNPGDTFVVFEGEENLSPLELERFHLDKIKQCDALIVCCPGGYVGASALIEIGFAHALGRRIIFTEKPEEFMLNTLPHEVM